MNLFAIGKMLAVIAVMTALNPSAEANAPSGQYTVAAATVYDTQTKLTWQRTVSTTTGWSAVKDYCSSAAVSSALGGSGWRLPTYKELLTIVDYSQTSSPLIDRSVFLGTSAITPNNGYFWSATPHVNNSSLEWYVNIGLGVATYANTSLSGGYVLCVR